MSNTKLPPIPPSLATHSQPQTKAIRQYNGLSGPNYSLTSATGTQKYALPPSVVLQPYVDTRAGTLDTWPAHALGPSPPDLNPGHVKQSNEFMPKGLHKPKFLEQLEAFLQKELRSLDCTDMVPSEKRLQAFREVFEYLIEDFKTYKPLLSAIKHEYEMMLVNQRDKIRELEPLKSMLVTVSEQCEKKLLAVKQEEKADMLDLKKENQRLRQVISKFRSSVTYKEMDILWGIIGPWFLGAGLVVIVAWLVVVCRQQHKTYSPRGRFVMITGCDSGFGREMALRLDRLGSYVLATCLTQKGAEELKSLTSARLNVFIMDVTNSEQIQETFGKVQKKLMEADSGLWGLVNNAGIYCWGPIEWHSLDTFKRTADVNLWGMIDVTKTFLPLLKAAKGRVVNFSSVSGRISFPNHGPYSITKYGVEAFSDTLRREMAPWGVGVSAIEPGGFKTRLTSPQVVTRHVEKVWSSLSEEVKAEYGQQFFTERLLAMSKLHDNGTISADLFKVVDAVVDALTTEWPRSRYVVGSDARFLTWLSRLPTKLEDMLLDKISKGSSIEAHKGPSTR